MFKIKFIQLFVIIIITSCSGAPIKSVAKTNFVPDVEEKEFVGITKIEDFIGINNYKNKFIVAAPDHKRFSEFNKYFQLGILTAKKQLNFLNEVEFINQENLNLSEANENFLIGPLSNEIISNIDGLISKNNALFLNDAKDNYSISLNQKSQIFSLENYLSKNSVNRIGIIEDTAGSSELVNQFKSEWFDVGRDSITIKVNNDPSKSIENFMDVAESKIRFSLIEKASFSDIEFVPRTRKDFKQIVIFTDNLGKLYEIASLVRFNYGLDYEIFSLTSNFNSRIDANEISLHDIKLVDHTYENKFSYDLSKSRSFCLGFDAMLISFAIANSLKGELRGLLGIYKITSEKVTLESYIN